MASKNDRSPLESLQRSGFLAATVLGIVAATSGCSTSAPENASARYVPTAPPQVQAVQVHKPALAGNDWTLCQKDCPQPTAKTFPQPKPPVPVATQTLVLSADVLFGSGSATVISEGRKVLDDLGAKLKAQGALSISVVGYTDRLGSDDYNMQLSQRRAEAVKSRLSAFVDASAIKAMGRGKANPVTRDDCSRHQAAAKLMACLQPDRRVEINVTQRKG